ncbi:MAG: DUF433 domain-containing protein [Candidatus Omnitrophica bacterium]|nr:DUF433 domain-containing protein [Candidatus Omnitrophota bacterium]
MKNGNLIERITVDANIQHGKPCIKGTRTPVYVILEALSLGMAPEEIKTEYPPINDEDIKAALLFAAMLANEEEIPLASVS